MLSRLTHLRRRLVLSLACVCASLAGSVAAAATVQKHVLVLHSSRRDAQISIVTDRDLPRLVESGLSRPLDYHSEYIDLPRFAEPGYEDALQEFLRRKYASRTFDAIVAMQQTALGFVARHRSLFPDTPVVFLANEPRPAIPSDTTGIVVERRFDKTVRLMLALQPDVRNVFVVSGANDSDRQFEMLARAQFRPFEPRLAFVYLAGLAAGDLESRLARLPPHSAVYYLLVYQDAAGENFHPLEYLSDIARIASAPTYSWVDSAMDRGAVGGSLVSQEAELEALSRLVLRVLSGEQAANIPVSAPELNVPQVDWRELRRWNIGESRVPPGTLVRFRNPGVWERYRAYLVAAAMLLIAQTVLIAGLLVQRRMRRRAEARVSDSEAALRTSHERIHDLGGRLLQAQEAERSRIARELHDDINQQVALLAIDLELLKQGDDRRHDAARLVNEACERAHDIARSVHDLSHQLHPAKLRLLGVVPALAGLQRELSRPDFVVAFTHDDVPPSLPPEVSLCLFRVVQEALQNAMKHSGAKHVSVHLHGDIDAIELTVVDDGVGFDVKKAWGRGIGLVSMGERLESVAGTLDVKSRPGQGTRLAIRVPFHPVHSANVAAV